MKVFMCKFMVTLFASITFATMYHYWPKDEYVGVKADTIVEIHSSKGVVTEAKQ